MPFELYNLRLGQRIRPHLTAQGTLVMRDYSVARHAWGGIVSLTVNQRQVSYCIPVSYKINTGGSSGREEFRQDKPELSQYRPKTPWLRH